MTEKGFLLKKKFRNDPYVFLFKTKSIEVVISNFWKAAKVKGCGELEEWIDPIVNHFWYCCQVADGSFKELKVRVNISLITFIN